MSHETIVQNINNRYNDTSTTQDSPSIYNNGVMLHVLETALPSVEPSEDEIKRGKMSFSLLRKDISTKLRIPVWGGNQIDAVSYGYIINPCNGTNYSPLCFFPVDSVTWQREYCGCGNSVETVVNYRCDNMDNPSSCAGNNVLTAEEYLEKYTEYGSDGTPTISFGNACSFYGNDKQSLEEAFKVINSIINNNYKLPGSDNNEFIIREWSNMGVNNLPIEAFFYVKQKINSNSSRLYDNEQEAINKAIILKDEYLLLTGKDLPIVSIDTEITENGDVTTTLTPFTLI